MSDEDDDLESLLAEAERAVADGDLVAGEAVIARIRGFDDPAIYLETAPIMRRLLAVGDERWRRPPPENVAFRAGTLPDRPGPDDRVVVPMHLRIEDLPHQGYRLPGRSGHSGWVLWAGEDELVPAESMNLPYVLLEQYWPDVVPYLSLPAGWNFRRELELDETWFDEALVGENGGHVPGE